MINPTSSRSILRYCTSQIKVGAGSHVNGSSGGGRGLFGQQPNNNIFERHQPQEKLILDVSATNVKVGPLRFYLQMFLFSGEISNTPVRNAWLTQQGKQEGEIQVFYHDGSGMISIQLSPTKIVVTRHGMNASEAYQCQESRFLHCLLDELYTVAFGAMDDGTIEASQRLLQLDDENAINKARKALPDRQAE